MPLNNPTVSVILTSFNHGKFIREAIDSILKQTFVNFELFIWDDASTDDSWQIIESYDDPRIHAYRNAVNAGPTYGVNKVIFELARGSYIAIHHSDDVWELSKLQEQVDYLDKHSNVGAVFSTVRAITESGQPLDGTHYYFSIFNQENRSRHEWLRRFLIEGNALCHPSVLIRKECYQVCGPYQNLLAQLPDFDMWIRVALRFEIYVIQKPLVRFRVLNDERNTSGSRPDSRMRHFSESYRVLQHYRSISNFDELEAIFPEVAVFKSVDCYCHNCLFLLGLVTVELQCSPPVKLFALNLIFDALINKECADSIESKYNFNYQSLIDLTGRIDSFSVEASRMLQELVAERDRQIVGLNQAVAERDKQIVGLNQLVAERDKQIVGLNQLVAERDKQIVGLNHLRIESDTAAAQVSAILDSTSWRLTAPLRSLSTNVRRVRRLFRVLPDVIARGGGITGTATKAARILYRDGLSGVRNRLRSVETTPPGSVPFSCDARAESADSFRIVPYYVDPRLDTQEPKKLEERTLAVHLHLFYPEMIKEIAERLANIPCAFDLFVSTPQSADGESIAAKLREFLPRVGALVIEPVPNRGRDIAPMIVQFGERLSRYSVVGHFHTKKSPHNHNLESWFSELLDHLLGPPGSSGGRLAHFFELLQANAKIIYPEGRTEFIKDRSGWADNRELSRWLLARHTNFSIDEFPVVEFPEGAMFWARSTCLKQFLRLPLSFEDFPAEPIPPDGTLAHALERLILIFASSHEGQCLRLHRGDSIPDYRWYEPRQDYSESIMHRDVKVLAYYLPQFHPIPENDLWHGEGFTEWTKVRAANPLFNEHYQQHIPHRDIGYYLLDSPDILRKQSDLMRQAGVHGQVFYHYWFGGKLILEEPARMLLATLDIDMPFCFCWANENWTRRWDGNESEILLAQNYSSDDAHAFIRYLVPFFLDRRYIRVDDRPLLFVYRPSSIPDVRVYLEAWAAECEAAGLQAPYVVAVLTRGATHPAEFGMDAGVERVLHDWTAGGAQEIKGNLTPYAPINGSVLSYDEVANYYSAQTEAKDFTYFRSLVPMWDNTARYGSEAYVVHGSSPERFQEWLEGLIEYTRQTLQEDRRFILINAWNEWAEGAHLEPDSRYGYSYLNSVGRALSSIPYAQQLNFCRSLDSGVSIHLVFPAHFRKLLADDHDLARRFIYGLMRSTIFERCKVTFPPDFDTELLPNAQIGSSAEADFVLEFRLISFFLPHVIEEMVQTAISCPESVVIANAYDSDRLLVKATSNGSVESADAYAAPLVLFPARMPLGGYKNFRMRTNAHCFVTYPNSLAKNDLPVVTTIIRFHKNGDFGLLSDALACLAAMRNCVCVPLIAAQDLSSEQLSKLSALLDNFAWHAGHPPQVHDYQSLNSQGDLRAKMLNESLSKVETRYAAFLDYDDLIMSHAYEWLIERLRETGKAVAFGRVFSTSYDCYTGLRLERVRMYEYGYSYEEFLRLNHAPLHSFLLDLSKLDLGCVVYHEDQRYMEDYFLTLQIFTRDNCDWGSLEQNRYIGDYIHSINRSHTLAFANDADRKLLLENPEFIFCESRINNLRAKLVR